MTREILFRGFNEDPNGNEEIELNGKIIRGMWLYGGYHKHRKINYCFREEEPEDNIEHYIFIDRQADWNMKNGISIGKVIPETVSQYTGLNDKNGKKIFENDNVKYPYGCFYKVCFDPLGYWCLDGNGIRNSEMLIQPDINKEIEVIGTIFDKKEVSYEENM